MNTDSSLEPKKDYFAPMHTAEHILNQTMVRLFGCARSKTNHIEKNKSKCDYFLPSAPTEEQLREVEDMVNDVISRQLPVTAEELPRDVAEKAWICPPSPLPPGIRCAWCVWARMTCARASANTCKTRAKSAGLS